MKHDEFGDRMKEYESLYTNTKINNNSWMCVRIDGKKFSKFTKGFHKPFDQRITGPMVETTKALVKETHASMGYTQSDEITLLFPPTEGDRIFDSKVSKINSVFASIATAHFNKHIAEHTDKFAYFDCRTWAVPSTVEASNVLLWRVQDAKKNSVSALFRWTAGAKAMHGLDQAAMKEYLQKNKMIFWDDIPNKWKYGTYVKPVKKWNLLTDEEMSKIPSLRRSTGIQVLRTRIEELDLGYFGDLTLQERTEVIQ